MQNYIVLSGITNRTKIRLREQLLLQSTIHYHSSHRHTELQTSDIAVSSCLKTIPGKYSCTEIQLLLNALIWQLISVF